VGLPEVLGHPQAVQHALRLPILPPKPLGEEGALVGPEPKRLLPDSVVDALGPFDPDSIGAGKGCDQYFHTRNLQTIDLPVSFIRVLNPSDNFR